jgi:hypothetical protein
MPGAQLAVDVDDCDAAITLPVVVALVYISLAL